jgi:hypothetical protein
MASRCYSPLFYLKDKDLSFEIAKIDLWSTELEKMEWNLDLKVTKKDGEIIQVEEISLILMKLNNHDVMVKSDMQTCIRQMKREYGEMKIMIRIKDRDID